MLHITNNTPANPIFEVAKWGTEKQVSDFINDVYPVYWTRECFNTYLKHWKPNNEN
jgi:hypothetical protein